MVTSIIGGSLIDKHCSAALIKKLATFGEYIEGGSMPPKKLQKKIAEYLEKPAKHTTDPARREERQTLFHRGIESISP